VRLIFLCLGWLALAVGTVGIVLPLLPTVPFYILAAFFFARGSPAIEKKLLDSRFGPHIRAWREKGAISRKGKWASGITLALSAAGSIAFAPMPWPLFSVPAVLASGIWIWTRPDS
jgi:uncharacterized membrane protein YbaN (DUF454 family)